VNCATLDLCFFGLFVKQDILKDDFFGVVVDVNARISTLLVILRLEAYAGFDLDSLTVEYADRSKYFVCVLC